MYRYNVEFFDEIESKVTKERGLVGAETFGTAADKLVEYYGKDNIFEMNLEEIEAIMPEEEGEEKNE